MDPNLPAQNNSAAPINKKVIIAAAGGFFLLSVVILIVLFSKPAAQKEPQNSVSPTPLRGNLPNPNISPKTPGTSSDKERFNEKNFPFAKQIFPEGPLASSASTVYQGYTLIRTPDSGGTRIKFIPSVRGYEPFEVLVKAGYRLYFSVESPSDPQEPAKEIDLGENFAITVDPEGFISE